MKSASEVVHRVDSAWSIEDAEKVIEADRREAKLEVLRELFQGEREGTGMWVTACCMLV